MIESAAFLVCLDETSPTEPEGRIHDMMMLDGFNRWVDKSLAFVVCKNATSGTCVEHTMIDVSHAPQLLKISVHTNDSKGNDAHQVANHNMQCNLGVQPTQTNYRLLQGQHQWSFTRPRALVKGVRHPHNTSHRKSNHRGSTKIYRRCLQVWLPGHHPSSFRNQSSSQTWPSDQGSL